MTGLLLGICTTTKKTQKQLINLQKVLTQITTTHAGLNKMTAKGYFFEVDLCNFSKSPHIFILLKIRSRSGF